LFGATDATLTGLFSTGDITLFDGSMAPVVREFSATISDPGVLSDGDLAVIMATTPEPATWALLGTGLFGLMSLTGARWVRSLGMRRGSGIALGLGFAVLLIPVSSKAATVKLNAVTSPSSGAAGTSTVSVTGSGFPTGTISPASALVSLSATCGGSGTTTAASAVQKVLGTTEKISFVVPGTLAAGTYSVSVSGMDSNQVDFTSGNCSTLQVVPGVSPTLTIDTTNPADWKIGNGALNIDFNPQGGTIFGLFPAGTTDNLIDLTNVNSHGPKGFYMDNAGFGTVTGVPGFVNANGYIDWWVTYPSSSSNAYTYTEHWVVTPNDPAVHVYFVADHSVSDIAGGVGQVQWGGEGRSEQISEYLFGES
jgi:hypothetical protein